jgi:hypothetical protein
LLKSKEQIMLKALILSTITAAISGAFIATANAGELTATIGWGCHTCGFKNGTQVTGLAPGSASGGTVGVVLLPSGERVDLR